jgi:colanic acid/amylovoran biosynthesis glycosyltransferase
VALIRGCASAIAGSISSVTPRAPASPTIAYIAPELTGLGDTVVYQEIVALEDMGYRVLPFALQEPEHPAREAQSIAYRTQVLYRGGSLARAVKSLGAVRRLGWPAWRSFALMLGDMRRIGWTDRRAWGLLSHWLAGARMAQPLRESGCTHIHAHYVHAPTQIAMYASAMTGIPFTCTAHAHDLFRQGLLLAEKAHRARKLLTISHFNKAWLEALGVDSARVEVVRCAPDVQVRDAPPSRRRTGAYRIGTLGRLVERKGVDDLLHALAMLLRSGCAPVKLLVAGEGPERLRLQVLADQLGVHAHVEFVGSVAHHAVAHWMRSLDLFVAACKTDRLGDADGIPPALMEAMALGVPVVSTRISGVPELVIDGQTGFLAESGQPASLAARIDEAMSSPERARALGAAARAHVRWEFGRDLNLRRLVQHFAVPDHAGSRPVELDKAAA